MNLKDTNCLSQAIENLKFEHQSATMKCNSSIVADGQVKIICFFVTNLLSPDRMQNLAKENEEVCLKCINKHIECLKKEYKDICGKNLSLKRKSCNTTCEMMSRTSSDKCTSLVRTVCIYDVE